MNERKVQETLKNNPHLIEDGLTFKKEEVYLDGRYLDLYFVDKENRPLIVELKKGKITDKAVGQLLYYKSAFQRENGTEPRIMLIGASLSPSLRYMLNENAIEWKIFDWIKEESRENKKSVYQVINGWDIDRILKLAPAMDAPVRVIDYKNIPCGVHGAPLEKVKGGYKDKVDFIYKKQINQHLRNSTGRVIMIFHENNQLIKGYKNNRYIVAIEDKSGLIDPIMEVTNKGRGILRCKQWATVLETSFIEIEDNKTVLKDKYNDFLKTLKHRLIV